MKTLLDGLTWIFAGLAFGLAFAVLVYNLAIPLIASALVADDVHEMPSAIERDGDGAQ